MIDWLWSPDMQKRNYCIFFLVGPPPTCLLLHHNRIFICGVDSTWKKKCLQATVCCDLMSSLVWILSELLEVVWNAHVSRDKSWRNSLNAKERRFNVSFLIKFCKGNAGEDMKGRNSCKAIWCMRVNMKTGGWIWTAWITFVFFFLNYQALWNIILSFIHGETAQYERFRQNGTWCSFYRIPF